VPLYDRKNSFFIEPLPRLNRVPPSHFVQEIVGLGWFLRSPFDTPGVYGVLSFFLPPIRLVDRLTFGPGSITRSWRGPLASAPFPVAMDKTPPPPGFPREP